jgi:hypothetical protein
VELLRRPLARHLERSEAYAAILLRAVARHGVSEDVLRYPLRYVRSSK